MWVVPYNQSSIALFYSIMTKSFLDSAIKVTIFQEFLWHIDRKSIYKLIGQKKRKKNDLTKSYILFIYYWPIGKPSYPNIESIRGLADAS